MKVLVVYASRLGSTAGIAERIAARLRSHGLDAVVRPADAEAEPGDFHAFVIGSAVYAGHWLKEASRFVDRHASVLSTHPVWLFSSGPVGETATHATPVEPAESGDIRRSIRVVDQRVFAGSLDRRNIEDSDLGFAERFIAKRFVPEGEYRDWPQIDSWADGIAAELLATPVGGR
ncbi:MAG TPA: flavodoxin domain-containing protein [Candidatus Limnocylindrales bacterium]|nr:flavodoxin domain-containing protein [Candidatus Limnocylindrales bacterium]